MKKILIGISFCCLCFLWSVFAASEIPDEIFIETSEVLNVNEAVNMKITALKNNKIMQDYEGIIALTIKNADTQEELDDKFYTLPDFWFIEFEEKDMGVVTTSNGLMISEPWNFIITATDINSDQGDDEILGSFSLRVLDNSVVSVEKIEVVYPMNGITENKSEVTVSAKSPTLKNSLVEIHLNDEIFNSSFNENGNLNVVIHPLKEWENTLRVYAKWLNDLVKGESEEVIFFYDPSSQGDFQQLTITPSDKVVVGDMVLFHAKVDPLVTSVALSLNSWDTIPLDRIEDWIFEKKMMIELTGDIVVDATTYSLWETKNFAWVWKFFVEELARELKEAHLTLTPYTGILLWDTLTFDVTVDPLITSVSVELSGTDGKIQTVDLVKDSDEKFFKQTIAAFTGEVTVSFTASWNSVAEPQVYRDVLKYYVNDLPTIWNVLFNLDQNTWALLVTWEVYGDAHSFRVFYGLSWEDLKDYVDIDANSVTFNNLDVTKEYFFKIIPLVWNFEEHSAATDIYVYKPPYEWSSPSYYNGGVSTTKWYACIVKGVRVRTEKIWRSYYLVWDPVPNATSYILYSSDVDVNITKKKIIETTSTRYEYPFDYSSDTPVYEYFWVEAVCSDNSIVSLTDAQKVQVWPTENIALIVVLSLFVYAWIRLYRYSE